MSQAPAPPEGMGATPPTGPGGASVGQVPSERATFWQRFGAALVDGILLWIVSAILNTLLGNSPTEPNASASGIQLLIAIGYYVYFHGSPSGQTIGKKVLNIRVVGANHGGPIGYGVAALRYVGSILSAIPCLLGYFWMLWDNNKQTWHDKIATTVVVPESAAPVEKWPG